MNSLKVLIAATLISLGMAGLAQAAENAIVTKASAHSVTETLDKLAALVKKKGMTVFTRIDHKANAKAVGKMITDSQVLIFGNANLGTRMMWHDPKVALDLPMRVLVYEDAEDKVWLVYRRPMALNNDFAVSQCASVLDVENALNMLTDEVVK